MGLRTGYGGYTLAYNVIGARARAAPTSMIDTVPFDVAFEISPAAVDRIVDVTLEMASEDGLEEMDDLFDCLRALAQLGAFSAEESRQPPTAAWQSAPAIRGARWRRSLVLHGVHASFWRVLLQMCVQCHYHLAPLHSVTVMDGSALRDDVPVGDVLGVPYLRAPRDLPFRLARSGAAAGDVVAIRATAAFPFDEASFDEMKKAFEDWGSLVYVGGFASPHAAMDDYQLERVEVGRLHPTLIECAAIGWTAPSAALDCAIRLAVGLHRTVIPIVELETE